MKRNFFEILVLEPKEKVILTSEGTLRDLQEMANILASGKGTIDAKYRKSVDHPNRLIFAAAWETIEDHNEFDVQGLVPKLLKLMLAHLNLVAAQFMFMDSQKVDFEARVWTVDAFHVKEEDRNLFQKEIDIRTGLVGAWYITKQMPPLPKVMPTDPVELKLLEEGAKRAEARLKAPTPNICMSISSEDSRDMKFGESVKGFIREVQSGRYEKFVNGKKI